MKRLKSMRSTLMTLIFCAALAGLCMVQPLPAADYPTRPIKVLTMVKPGAQIDLLTRKLADEMSAELGQPVLVVNTPGGSHGSVMAMDLKNSKADGYTLGVGPRPRTPIRPISLKHATRLMIFNPFPCWGSIRAVWCARPTVAGIAWQTPLPGPRKTTKGG